MLFKCRINRPTPIGEYGEDCDVYVSARDLNECQDKLSAFSKDMFDQDVKKAQNDPGRLRFLPNQDTLNRKRSTFRVAGLETVEGYVVP